MVTPRKTQNNTLHIVTIYENRGGTSANTAENKDRADYLYNSGVSLVNRNLAKGVLWNNPDGTTYKKYGEVPRGKTNLD